MRPLSQRGAARSDLRSLESSSFLRGTLRFFVGDEDGSEMKKGRLEAFSDGVLAVIITIMVLELKVPHGADTHALAPLVPVFLTYVLSFVTVAIYWNNHHHLFHAVDHVSGGALWANLHLLFWLSLIPFATGWMNENRFTDLTVAAYGGVLLCSGIAYFILTRALLAVHDKDSLLAKGLGNDFKGKISLLVYMVAIVSAFLNARISLTLYAVVALLWLVPDRRFERLFTDRKE
jgi:uncharacterized membrane protein